MGRCCAFPNCNNKQKSWSPISFFKLPLHDTRRCQLWLRALQLAPNTSKRTIRRRCLLVCSAHFSPHDLVRHEQRTCPTPTAVPFSAPAADTTGDEAADQSKYEDACPAFKEPVAAGLPNPPSPKARGGPVRKRRSEVPEQPPTRTHRKLSSADTDVTSSSSEATDRGDARSERHDFPAVEDADCEEPVATDLPQPPPLKERPLLSKVPLPDPEHTTAQKASSSDTEETSPSSEVMDRGDTQSEDAAHLPRPPVLERMRKKLSNVPLPDPEQTGPPSEATADPGADTDVLGPDAGPSPAETTYDPGEPGSVPAAGPCGQGSGCGAAAGQCLERKWVVIESRLLELYHNCSHCGAVAAK